MPSARIETAEALDLFQERPLLELMTRANDVRHALHPTNEVTFVVDTNPNYTNVCVTDCTFCSFYRRPGDAEAYTLDPTAVAERVARAQSVGATTVLLQGGHHPDLPFEYYLNLIASIQHAAPGIHLHLFSPAEIMHMSETCDIPPRRIVQTFWDMGVRTMPGGGAEILVDSVRRKVSPKKISADSWINVMRLAHEVGMKTSATMTYGHRETKADIVEHLMRIRQLQDETGGFYAFIPWSFKPGVSPLGRLVPEAASSAYYLRVIALARLVLDNVPHIQASWFGEGWRAGQLALHAGADDFGGLLLEENVLYQARHKMATNLNSMLTMIRDAGFTPVQRTTPYEKLRRYTESEFESHGKPVLERVPGVAGSLPETEKSTC